MKTIIIRIVLAAVFLLVGFYLPSASSPFIPSMPNVADENAVLLPGVQLVGSSGHIEIRYSSDLNPSGGGITIEAWVKRDALNRHETLVGNGYRDSYWLGFSSQGKLSFTPYGNKGEVESSGVVPAGIWTHVAVTYDGLTRRFFINGVLDSVSALKPGPIAPAPSGHSLGIGFDPDDMFEVNYFGGRIDNLRIWNYVRNQADIRKGMFQSIGRDLSGLLAEFPFDGSAMDTAGGHVSVLVGQVSFGNEGALPHDIRIPNVSTGAVLDGACESDEYANAIQVTVDGTAVLLMHTASDLWVCFADLGAYGLSAALYLDALPTRLDPAQVEHLRFEVRNSNENVAREGDGEGGWVETSQADGLWEGKYLACCKASFTYRAEFRLNWQLLKEWNHLVGLSLEKTTTSSAGQIIRLWPALADGVSPSTWSRATLGGTGPARSFSGQVSYQPPGSDGTPLGVPGVLVNLIASDPSGGEALVASGLTNLDGGFSLASADDYPEHRLELGALPRGSLAQDSAAPAPGNVVDARTIEYGSAPVGSYTDAKFNLGDGQPYPLDPQTGPFFLILAPKAVIDSGAIDGFRDFKTRLGFQVSVYSLESVDAVYEGSNRMERIRALELARLNSYGSRFQYMLLIGPNSVIPFAQFTVEFDGRDKDKNIDLDACKSPPLDDSSTQSALKLKLSDWPFVDPTSNFDSNGNGCLLDGVSLYRTDRLPAPGYTPDVKPAFLPTIAVGRIPFDSPAAVETALTNSVRFEAQSRSFKQRTLHAMSMFALKGQHWTPVDSPYGHFEPCTDASPGASGNCKHYTDDAAYYSEQDKTNFLTPRNYQSTVLYEAAKPEGACPVVSPKPLTQQNVLDELATFNYGVVNIAGHGGSAGIGRRYWENVNGNNQVDSPTEPLPFISLDEIGVATLVNKTGLSTLAPAGAKGAIFQADSCSVGSGLDEGSFGATLLADGHGVAFIGALSMVSSSVQKQVEQRLLDNNMRLGNAVWQGLSYLALHNFTGSTELATDLFGDPTLSYWGNPGGQSTLAAWPMLRYDARGQGFTSLAGPEFPKKLWEYLGTAPWTSTLPPSPLVSNNGEVIVANGWYVDVLRDGELYQRLQLGAPAFGAPALSADGTIYAMDIMGRLYAFQYPAFYSYGEFQPITHRTQRWVVDAVDGPSVSPIISPDGFIIVADEGKVVLVRQDGYKRFEFTVWGMPVGALAAGANQVIYVSTNNGVIYRRDLFCPSGYCSNSTVLGGLGYSTPPLLAHKAVYVGTADGWVRKLDPTTLVVLGTYQADSAISAGPIAGPGNQVLVGTTSGKLISLTADLQLRWQVSLSAPVEGVPAFSADALYVVSSDRLYAYNPASGILLWSRILGNGAGRGSVAVGYGRELYVQTANGKLQAFGNNGWLSAPYQVAQKAVQTKEGKQAIRLDWLASSTKLGFLVQRRLAGSDWEDLSVVPGDTFVITDTKIVDNAHYAYRVQRLDPEGNDSDFTQALTDERSLPALPGAPDLKTVLPESATALRLEWSPPGDDDVVRKYRIERRLSTSSVYTTTAQVSGEITSTVDEGLAPATSYTYRMTAINDFGESAPSAEQKGVTRALSLSAPQNVTATLQTDGRVLINWQLGPSGAFTVIEYSELGMDGFRYLDTTSSAGPWSYSPGEPNTYQYRCKFVSGDAESPYSQAPVIFIPPVYKLVLPAIYKGR